MSKLNELIVETLRRAQNPDAVRFFFRYLAKLIKELDISPEDENVTIRCREDSRKLISVNFNNRLVFGLRERNAERADEQEDQLLFMVNEEDYNAIKTEYISWYLGPLDNEGFTARLVYFPISKLKNRDITNLISAWLKSCKVHAGYFSKSNYRRENLPELFEIPFEENLIERYLVAANHTMNQLDPIKQLIDTYKKHLREVQLGDELYKWQLVQKYRGRPDVNAPDFTQEVKSMDYANLIYQIGFGVMKDLARERPQQYRACYIGLFNESEPLQERLDTFTSETLKLFREIEPDKKKSHHHDERTMATILAYFNPDKYPFYKDTFYRKYCKLLGVKHKPPGQKYVHYMQLHQELIDNYINPDTELTAEVQSYLPVDAYQDPNHMILAQDILYIVLDQGFEEIDIGDARVFKVSMGSFSDVDLTEILKTQKIVVHGDTHAKGVSAITQGEIFEEQMQPGDYFYLTHGNKHNAVRLLGRITGPAAKATYKNLGPEGWLERPFELILFSKSKSPYSGPQKWWTPNNNSTCIQIKDTELDEANKLLFIPYFRVKLIPGEEGSTLAKTEPKKEVNKMKDQPVNRILYGPPGTGKTYTLANEYYPKFTENVDSIGEEEVLRSFVQDYAWWQVIAAALLTFDNFSSTVPVLAQHPLIQAKFNPSKKYPTPNHILWQQLQSHTVATSTTVGKTNRAASHLIFDKSEEAIWRIVAADNSVAEEIGVEKLLDYKNLPTATTSTARQHYTFVTFHQSFSYEDFIEGIKPVLGKAGETETAIETDNEISYEIRKGIFYKACLSALYLAGYRSFSECLDDTKENRKQRFAEAKPYGLFIDEINRANVSNVLGELITLVEEDKRLGKEQELWASLPYSQEQFGVPANLYLIGTMNTADRSVEALDTALRRRFMFEEMPPQPQLLSTNLEGVDLQKLLTAINERIELLLDRDHCIGHSYFINLASLSKLREAFSRAIIPLLQEYFYGHWGRIGMVLGKRFVVAKPSKATLSGFGDDEAADLLESRKLYAFTDPATWDVAAFTSIYNTGKAADSAEE